MRLEAGCTLGLLGESGAGKSTLAMAIIGLLQAPEVTLSGSMRFAGEELVDLAELRFQKLRGNRFGLVFQDATSSLDPCFTIGKQICEPLRRHLGLDRKASVEQAVALLTDVGIPDARFRLSAYPHQLSGGMQQRVMISIALACNPERLIADEPTSALDVTIQAQIMVLILERARALKSSAIFVLHDLALASQGCDDIAVLYAGQIVETGPAAAVLDRPLHPYTTGLRSCVVELASYLCKRVAVMYLGRIIESGPTATILSDPIHPYTRALMRAFPSVGRPLNASLTGEIPSPINLPAGCRFASRCPGVRARCHEADPSLAMQAPERRAACWYPLTAQQRPQLIL